MQALLDRRLIVVTGKGGVGKTTVAAALGCLAARSGRRTTIVEVGGQSRLATLFGRRPGEPGSEVHLEERLSAISIDPDRALLEWVQALGGRVPGRILTSSGTFQYFAAAAPGAREIVTMIKIWRLAGGSHSKRAPELVIFDAPATGHALGMLRSPETFSRIARVGPIVRDTGHVRELLGDPARSAYLGVAQGTEMAVTETIELQRGLEEAVGRGLDAAVVNALLPRRFSAPELDRIDALAANGRARDRDMLVAAARAAHEIHARASYQHGQVARLRRRGFEVIGLPFVWAPALDLEALDHLVTRLEHGVERGSAAAAS